MNPATHEIYRPGHMDDSLRRNLDRARQVLCHGVDPAHLAPDRSPEAIGLVEFIVLVTLDSCYGTRYQTIDEAREGVAELILNNPLEYLS